MEKSASTLNGSTYKGSFAFSSIADTAGMPIDQFNFLFSEVLALILAMIYRKVLPPRPSNRFIRHFVASILGFGLAYFCFGLEIWHVFAQSFIVYFILCVISPKYSHLVVFVFAMVYMSVVHIHRLIYDYGNYTLDISGPLMINTQKLTALAFAFYDGYRWKKQQKQSDSTGSPLNADQEKQKITELPSLLEFVSYIFYFHGVIVGPLCFYKDYRDFIEGQNLLVIPTTQTTTMNKTDEQRLRETKQPSIAWAVLSKLLQCAFWGYILIVHTPSYPVDYNLSAAMLSSPVYKRLAFLLFSTFCARVKYYFAFILSEAVNNAAGLGFNGYDKTGVPQWNLLTNVEPFQIESATSLKVLIDKWNMQTGLWLRRVCYDRLPFMNTLGVFVLSALWHGFYPGYYVCFILAAFETYAGRGIRRQIRPLFQANQLTKSVYAIITWLGTQIGLNFAVTPFVLMEIQKAWDFYVSWYFIVPIISIVLALVLNGASSKSKKNQKPTQDKEKSK